MLSASTSSRVRRLSALNEQFEIAEAQGTGSRMLPRTRVLGQPEDELVHTEFGPALFAAVQHDNSNAGHMVMPSMLGERSALVLERP